MNALYFEGQRVPEVTGIGKVPDGPYLGRIHVSNGFDHDQVVDILHALSIAPRFAGPVPCLIGVTEICGLSPHFSAPVREGDRIPLYSVWVKTTELGKVELEKVVVVPGA